jgi:hypothetical protein
MRLSALTPDPARIEGAVGAENGEHFRKGVRRGSEDLASIPMLSDDCQSASWSRVGGFCAWPCYRFEVCGLTMAFERASVASEVASTSFRFPETKSAHLKFSPLSDNSI